MSDTRPATFQPLLPLFHMEKRERGASVRLGHKRLRTLMKRSSLRYLPGGGTTDRSMTDLFKPSSLSLCPPFSPFLFLSERKRGRREGKGRMTRRQIQPCMPDQEEETDVGHAIKGWITGVCHQFLPLPTWRVIILLSFFL